MTDCVDGMKSRARYEALAEPVQCNQIIFHSVQTTSYLGAEAQ